MCSGADLSFIDELKDFRGVFEGRAVGRCRLAELRFGAAKPRLKGLCGKGEAGLKSTTSLKIFPVLRENQNVL